MQNTYYPSTWPIQHAGTGPVLGTSTGPMLDHFWPSTGAVQHVSIGPVNSLCAAHVLARYCHVSCVYTLTVYSVFIHGIEKQLVSDKTNSLHGAFLH